MEVADRVQAGRLASWLFLLAGSVTFLNSWLPVFETGNAGVVRMTSGAAVVVGLICLRLPWQRWPLWASLLLVPIAMVIIGVFRAAGSTDGYTFSLYFVLVFTWMGVAQPRWTSLWVAPFAAITYVVALAYSPEHSAANIASVTVTIPVCILVSETIAHTVQRLRSSQADGRRQAEDLEALAGAAGVLQGESDVAKVGSLVATTGAAILHADRVGVWLGTEASVLLPAGFHGVDPSELVGALSPREAAVALLSGTPGANVSVGPFAGGMLIPLRGPRGPVGVMAVLGGPDGSDGFAMHVAQLFGAQAGYRLEQLHVVERLTQASLQDPLTGVGNRRHASSMLEQLRPGDAVILMDLDHFKNVNDTYGHAAGDVVLVELGHYLRNQLRDKDSVARYGGEEFIAILREGGESAIVTAQRLVESWAEKSPVTTFSAGVAVHQVGRSAAATLGRSDAALYRAKSKGRNMALADDALRFAE